MVPKVVCLGARVGVAAAHQQQWVCEIGSSGSATVPQKRSSSNKQHM